MLEPRPPRGAGQLPAVLRDARAFAWTSALVLLLGAPVGLLWSQLAPRPDVLIESAEQASLVDFNTDDYVVGDLLLLALAAGAGLLSGAVAWRFGRRHLAGVVLALAVGGLGAGCVAEEVGERRFQPQVRAAIEQPPPVVVEAALRVRATTVRLGWPAGALAGVALVGLLRSSSRRSRELQSAASGGSWAERP